MARHAALADLFGAVPQHTAAAVEDPAGDDTAREDSPRMLYPAVPPGGHTPDTIRPILLGVIEEARALATLDWDARTLRSHTAMVPYMAEWLKGGEGDRLLLEFKEQMDRLHAPADQVAPNWREMWG